MNEFLRDKYPTTKFGGPSLYQLPSYRVTGEIFAQTDTVFPKVRDKSPLEVIVLLLKLYIAV